MLFLNPHWADISWKEGPLQKPGKWVAIIAIVLTLILFKKFQVTADKWQVIHQLWSPLWFAVIILLYRLSHTFVVKRYQQSLFGDFGNWFKVGYLNRLYYIHITLFFLLSALYVSVVWTVWVNSSNAVLLMKVYSYVNIFIAISLLLNGLHILYFLFKIHYRNLGEHQYLLLMLSSSIIIISCIMLLLSLLSFISNKGLRFDYSLLIYILIGLDIVLICAFLFRFGRNSSISSSKLVVDNLPDYQKRKYRYSALEKNKKVYVDRLGDYLESSACYLNPNLTLNCVAEKINIPKHHLSEIINMEFEKNFFQYLADYRISYAMKYLEEAQDNYLTVETLAYECGFNSKTSFNRYFKERSEGFTPSEYRLQFHGKFNRAT